MSFLSLFSSPPPPILSYMVAYLVLVMDLGAGSRGLG